MAVRALTGMSKRRRSELASSIHGSIYERKLHLTEALGSAYTQSIVCRSYTVYHQQTLSLWWPIGRCINGPVLCP